MLVSITIDGEPEEIAALAAEMRERQGGDTLNISNAIEKLVNQPSQSL